MPKPIEQVNILDDDASVVRSLQELLASDGLMARVFQSPSEFLAYANNNPLGLVILDVWMPEINGLEVQARLKKVSPQTRVIIITGRDEGFLAGTEGRSLRSLAIENGAFAFLTKPFDDEEFLGFVRSALESVET
jgi:FixJ family two-component response regulator